MPVFHTKTIESILEPVAQQVSKLVILHEEAEDGNAMPDLARPVQAVKMAVDNLVRVGYETITNSEDAFLKHDMPPALNRVEEASLLLLDASGMLRDDPFSAPARKKLIEGSRGILQGTSALLLAFDESEVRKIIRICKNVLEYLAITEVVESMSDLVTFVKNLSPILTRMTKEVDAREKELTHQVHRQWLIRSLEQVKTLTPVLISAIKIYLTTRDVGGQGLTEAQANRDYTVGKMSTEIHEIIRVLQLTTYDEDEWDADDMTVMKKAQNAIDGRMKLANDWLLESNAPVGSSGERCLRQILEDAHRVAERCINEEDQEGINKLVSDITSMSDALCELRQQGKGTSPQAMSLARGIQDKLKELQARVNTAVLNTDKSGVRKPAHTMSGKAEQAQRWLANPGRDDHGLGEESTRLMIAEGRRAAEGLQGMRKADLQRHCDEVELLTNQLSDLCRRGMGDSAQARSIAANLSQKLHSLKHKIQDALTTVVADDFLDITTPLKQMSDAAFAPKGSPGREATFEDKARRFDNHAAQLSTTARLAARAGKSTNKDTIEGIQDMANQVEDLTPQVIKAARIVMLNPDNPAATEHFELLKRQWTENVERLRNLVDEAVDTAAFVKAQEVGIIRDTELAENAVKNNDAYGVVNRTSSIARRANRVLQVAQQEAENSEDPLFVDRVNDASRHLRNTITPMVQSAKALAQDPRNPGTQNIWRTANQRLINAVGDVRSAVTIENEPDYSAPQAFAGPPDMSHLSISGGKYSFGGAIDIDLEELTGNSYRSTSGYRSDSPYSTPRRAQDIRGEMRGRGRSESPRFQIGAPVILDLEDLSLGTSRDRGRAPVRTPDQHEYRRPTRATSYSPDNLSKKSVSSLGSYPVGGHIVLDLEDLSGDLIDRKVVGSGTRSSGNRGKDCRVFRPASISPAPGFHTEFRTRGRSASPQFRVGTPVFLDLDDISGASLDRRRHTRPYSISPDRARSVSSAGMYTLGGPITLDLEDLGGDLVDRKVIASANKNAGGRLGQDIRMFRPASTSPVPRRRATWNKSPFTVGENLSIDLNALSGTDLDKLRKGQKPINSSRSPMVAKLNSTKGPPRSLLGGRRTVKSGEPIDIDLDDLVRKNLDNADNGHYNSPYSGHYKGPKGPYNGAPKGPYNGPYSGREGSKMRFEANLGVTPDNRFIIDPRNRKHGGPPSPPQRIKKVSRPSPPPPPVPVAPEMIHPEFVNNALNQAPPRPPLPRDSAPPRPPPPETDDEEEREVFSRPPQENQPIMMAAHALHMDVKEWSSRDNEIIGAAKRMAIQMAKLSQLVRGDGGSKRDLIDVAKRIAECSEEVTRLAKELAKECTDKRMRLGLLQVCERIPTIGTQLKILSTVKATMLGAQGSEEDQEATEMLVGNAQNLMQSVRETVRAAQAASIKIRVDSGYSICWMRKRPWFT